MLKPKETYSDIPSLDKQIEDIMNNFSFQAVEHFMHLNIKPIWDGEYSNIQGYESWKVYNPYNKTFQVPTEEDLRNDALRLLIQAKNWVGIYPSEVFYSVASGIFKVIYRYGIIELNAVFESWSND